MVSFNPSEHALALWKLFELATDTRILEELSEPSAIFVVRSMFIGFSLSSDANKT